jgi:hypothetical protein
MIFSSVVISKVSLTQLLIPRAAVQIKEEKSMGSVYIPYAKGISEKLRCIGNRYNIRTIYKTKHTLRNSLKKTRPERDPQQTAQCICSIPLECGRSYIGETGYL